MRSSSGRICLLVFTRIISLGEQLASVVDLRKQNHLPLGNTFSREGLSTERSPGSELEVAPGQLAQEPDRLDGRVRPVVVDVALGATDLLGRLEVTLAREAIGGAVVLDGHVEGGGEVKPVVLYLVSE